MDKDVQNKLSELQKNIAIHSDHQNNPLRVLDRAYRQIQDFYDDLETFDQKTKEESLFFCCTRRIWLSASGGRRLLCL
jgi:hypothetical protein